MKKLLVAACLCCFLASGLLWDAALASPPPWAPAHGYHGKHKDKHARYEHGQKHKHKNKNKHKKHRKSRYDDDHYEVVSTPYVPPFDLNLGSCNRDALGAVIGGVAGAAVGTQVGKGDGKVAATIGGAIIGAVIGGIIGREMDNVDQNCVGQALEHAEDGQTITWNNETSGQRHQVVPTKTIDQGDGRYCREYISKSVINGRTQQTYGRACRQPDGSWRLVS